MFSFFKERKKMEDRPQSPFFFEAGQARDPERYAGVTIERGVIGKLVIPSGNIVACDPGFDWKARLGLRLTVPAGEHDMTLDIAKFTDGARRTSIATLWFHGGSVTRWERVGTYFTSTNGCFMSEEAQKALSALLDQGKQPGPRKLVFWSDVELDSTTRANMIQFLSPFPMRSRECTSYFGYDSNGRLLCLLTDFELFHPEHDYFDTERKAALELLEDARKLAETPKPKPQTSVAFATRAIKAGQIIKDLDYQIRTIDAELAPAPGELYIALEGTRAKSDIAIGAAIKRSDVDLSASPESRST